jgi:phosphatidylinositol phospholipase C, delta
MVLWHWQDEDELLYRERGADGDDGKETKHVAAEYKHLITIKAGKPKGPLVDAIKNDPDKVRRLSLSEQELAKVAAHHGPNIVRFVCQKYFDCSPTLEEI